jgi:hypothetical protein
MAALYGGTITIPILEVRKQKLREVEVEGHITSKVELPN